MKPDSAARQKLDAHVRDIVRWHFSAKTGTPFWINWAKNAGWSPVSAIKTFEDLTRFPHFNDESLRTEPLENWIPKACSGKPYKIFETGGTTGLPKIRLSWEDHLIDYSEYSETLDEAAFPRGANWLMLGPTGPRRLRLAIEHLANVRGGACFHVDLDPRWVVKLVSQQEIGLANRYKSHVIDQAVAVLKNRKIGCLFTTPKLLEALGEQLSLAEVGVKGVMCGGTSMTPQTVRFLVEEVLEQKVMFVPVYGNTLMGLARSKPPGPENNWSITYYAPQPRAVLRTVNPKNPDHLVEYGAYGRMELTTLTREFFMPRFLERDEGIRRPPDTDCPWDGVGDVRPFEMMEKKVVEGVY